MKIVLLMVNLIVLSSFFVSCSMMTKTSVSIFSEGLKDGAQKLEYEADYEYFQKSTPANLKMMESLLAVDPGNINLLVTLIQGFAAYGFGVYETDYLDDLFKEKNNGHAKQRAISFYTKAIDYAHLYLESKKIKFEDFLQATTNSENAKPYLNKHFSKQDYLALFFFAQAWGSLINLEKNNILLVGQLGHVKAIFDWVCEKEPTIQYGACNLFYATYMAGRPKMLGGDPEQAKSLFLEAYQKNTELILTLVSYLQYSVIPSDDEDEFDRVSAIIETFYQERLSFETNYAQRIRHDKTIKPNHLSLYNAIAWQKYLVMKQNKKNIF